MIKSRRAILQAALLSVPLLRAGSAGAEEVLSSEVMGIGSAIWPNRRIKLLVHTDPRWHPFIEKSVSEFNGINRLPHIDVEYRSHIDASKIRREDYGSGVAVMGSHHLIASANAWTIVKHKKHLIQFAKIIFSDWELDQYPDEFNQNTVCHELIHLLTWADDKCCAQSCIHGLSPTLTGYDRKLIKRTYDRVKRKTRRRGR